MRPSNAGRELGLMSGLSRQLEAACVHRTYQRQVCVLGHGVSPGNASWEARPVSSLSRQVRLGTCHRGVPCRAAATSTK